MATLFDQSTDPDSYRRRLAAALMTQGMDTSPVGHWTQGAARMANALVGGMMQRQLKGEQDTKDKEFAAALATLPGLGGGSAAAPMPQQPASLDQMSTDRAVPASIRYNNPGAQYPGPSATAFGSTGHGVIGGGHKIAAFNSPEEGAAAQFALLERGYLGLPLGQALTKWSGGNNAPAYIASVVKATGLSPNQPITPELLRGPEGVKLAQAMAQHEAGRPFPMSGEQWQTAQTRAFGGQPTTDGQALPPGATPAQGQMPQGAAPARQQVDIPPQVQQQIRAFLGSSDPRVKMLGMQLYQQYAKEGSPTDEMREYQLARQQGFPGSFFDFKTQLKQAGAIKNQVTVDQKGETEFSKEAGKLQAKRFDELASEGPKAQQFLSDIAMLQDLGTKFQSGKLAEFKAAAGPYAEALGIKVQGLSEIQTFEAIVNRLAPNMRVPGSGSQSDMELRKFLKSLPQVGTTPEGNAMVQRVLQGLYQNKLAASEIGTLALNKDITPQEAAKRLRELPDPMKEWREHQKAAKEKSGDGWREIKPGVRIRELP